MSFSKSQQGLKNLTPPEALDLEEIAEEFIAQLRAGKSPKMSDYIEQYPELQNDIEELFPAIAALEGGKYAAQSNGKVSLGSKPPQQLGDFKIIREIGRGGMGIVYEATQESLNRRVALKLLPRHSLLEEKQLKRFCREAELTASLHHTSIVPVFGVGENNGFHYYVMQLIDGIGLDELTQQLVATAADTSIDHPNLDGETISRSEDKTAFINLSDFDSEIQTTSTSNDKSISDFEKFVRTPRDIAALGIQVANALQYAHDRGILHRDIKPGNLLLDREGVLCITDFGLARAAEQSDLSKTSDMVGTLGYMAPEMFRGETSSQSDIYGLGITLYEILTKHCAIERSSRHQMIEQITRGSITPLRRLNPEISRDLETIVLKAISPDTKHRYQKASDLADDLNRFLEHRPIRAKRITFIEHLWRWGHRNPAIAMLSGLALVLCLLLGVSMAVGFEREREQRKRAENSSQLATSALDRVFNRFVPNRLHSPSSTSSRTDGARPILSHESAVLLAEMVQFYEELADSTGDQREFQLRAANAQHKVGKIHQQLGNFKSALESYQKSLSLYQQNPDKLDVLTIATLYNDIGRIYRYLGQPKDANHSYDKAQQLLLSAITQNEDQPALQFELAHTYFLRSRKLRPEESYNKHRNEILNSKHQELSNIDQRELKQTRLEKAIKILDKLSKSKNPDPEYRFLTALCLQEQISQLLPLSSDDYEKQERVYQILESLVKEFPNVADYRHAIVKSYQIIDIKHVPRHAIDEVLISKLEKAIQHANRLVSEHPTIPEYKISLVHSHNKLAHALEEIPKHSLSLKKSLKVDVLAEISRRTALRLQKELTLQFPESSEFRIWLAKLKIALANSIQRKGGKGSEIEAVELLEQAIQTLESELQTRPTSPLINLTLLGATREIALVFESLGKIDQSNLMWDKFHVYEATFPERELKEMERRHPPK